jgi:peptidoglycan hydrolase-like protein with peptidoglycan-binding domain
VVGAVLATLFTTVLVGCSSRGRHPTSSRPGGAAGSASPSSVAGDAVSAVSGAASTTSTTEHPPGLIPGDSGPQVLAMEQRLGALHYDVGTPDGHYGPADTDAVIAFQKVHGLDRTGRATPDVLAALATASDPAPLVPGGGAMRVEVDVHRQVLLLYEHDTLVRVLPVSTGSGHHYCENGDCGDALTPSGSYAVGRKVLGADKSPLGQLYNPLYFNGGIAIHGFPDVPTYPASHGCVRIPMSASLWFYNEVPIGTPVYVIGGSGAASVTTSSTSPPTSTPTSTPATTSTTAKHAGTTTTTTPHTGSTTSTSSPSTTTTTLR